jgi:Leucine-rich repeat (LRR) protein
MKEKDTKQVTQLHDQTSQPAGQTLLLEPRPAHPFMSFLADLDLSQPLPDNVMPPESLPGAWEQRVFNASNANPAEDNEQENVPSLPIDVDGLNQDNEGLAVAKLVEDNANNLPLAFPEAEESDILAATAMRERNRKKFKTYVLLAVLLLIAVLVILVAFLVPRGTIDTESQADSSSPSPFPSQPPTTVQDYYMALFPAHTISDLENPDSPQSNAFKWLLADEVNLPSLSDERIKQRFALATLYFATNGDMWVVNKNWLNYSVDECDWYTQPYFAESGTPAHVAIGYLQDFFPSSEPTPSTCRIDGIFQHLWLDHDNLVGTLPLELYMLTFLETLSLGANHLQGTMSSLVGQLTALQGLVIRNQENAGHIPTEIGILTNLRAIGLENDHTGAVPTELWLLTNLESLQFSINPNLKGAISTDLGNMANLKWLGFYFCGLSGKFASCYTAVCEVVCESSPHQYYWLTSTGTVPTEIGLLTDLNVLLLPGNQFSGRLPTEMGELTKLNLLSAYDNALEGPLPTEVGLLSSLVMFSVRQNILSGPIPSELGLLTNLVVTISMNNNQLSSTIPTQLGTLTNLFEIELSGNRLTGRIPSELGLLTRMTKLTFANNSLSGTIPQELSALWQSLNSLWFDGNTLLSGILPESLCDLNGTCAATTLNLCEGNSGLFFDCTSLLCGCDCNCSDGGVKETYNEKENHY